MLGNFACFFCRSLTAHIFFFNQHFSKDLASIPLECQTLGIQIRPDILSGHDLGQTVCKGYQQMTRVTASNFVARIEINILPFFPRKKNMPSAAVVIGVKM